MDPYSPDSDNFHTGSGNHPEQAGLYHSLSQDSDPIDFDSRFETHQQFIAIQTPSSDANKRPRKTRKQYETPAGFIDIDAVGAVESHKALAELFILVRFNVPVSMDSGVTAPVSVQPSHITLHHPEEILPTITFSAHDIKVVRADVLAKTFPDGGILSGKVGAAGGFQQALGHQGERLALPLVPATVDTFPVNIMFSPEKKKGVIVSHPEKIGGDVTPQTVNIILPEIDIDIVDTFAPDFTSATLKTTAENQTVLYIATATDTDSSAGSIRYSIVSGLSDDAALLQIDPVSGAISLVSGTPDFESVKTTYSFTVQATDPAGNDNQLSVIVTISNVDEVPPTITSGTTGNVLENQNLLYTVTATDPALDGGPSTPLTYSISGTDAALLNINSSTGAVTLASGNLDYETKNSYSFTVQATDAAGSHSQQTVTITIVNIDEVAPTITSTNSGNVFENQNLLYTTTSMDTDHVSGSTSYSFGTTGGSSGDAALLNINSSTGAVTLASGNLDYETKTSYTFTVVATDTAGNHSQQEVTISVVNLDEVPPGITSANSGNVFENQNLLYTTTSTDVIDYVSGSTSYSFGTTGGSSGDAALLNINSSTGAVTLASGNLDYETKTSYTFTVVATDTAGNQSQQEVTISVVNLDEVPPTITSANSGNAFENQNLLYTVTATDPALDGGPSTPLTYSISGTDAALLNINSSTGAVILASGNLDYETKNSYSFTVRATDTAGNQSQQSVTITVINIDEVAPAITSGNTGAVQENQNLLNTAAATDPALDGGPSTPLTYSISGTDAALLNINSSTGDVTLASGNLDYETKNSYSFTVQATDTAGNQNQQSVSINISNLDEVAPTITSANTGNAFENQNQLYTTTSTDVIDYVSGTTSYSFGTTGGSSGDAALLNINSSTGAVTLASGNLDYETKTSYTFTVVATDSAGNQSQQEVTISVINLDEAQPTITSANSGNAFENQNLLYTVTATDPALDGGPSNPITYAISGTDAALLNIDSSTGAVTLASSNLDYETKNSYSFSVQATDAAGNQSQQNVTITVINLDEVAPSITSAYTGTVQENQNLLYTVTATDPALDGGPSNPIAFAISGTDAALLNINSSTGAVTLASGNLDYETKNSYGFTVQATDAAGNQSQQSVTITVNGPPTLTVGASITRNGVSFTVTDPDSGDVLDYLAPFTGVATINNGSTSTIANAAQVTALSGDLSVIDNGGHTLALGLYLYIGTNGSNTFSYSGANMAALYGFDDADTLTGTDLADNYLFGGNGDDTLNGGQQDNVLEGGAGADQIFGGQGNNTYVYNAETVSLDEIIYFHDDISTTETVRIESYSDLRDLNGGAALDGLDAILLTGAGTGLQASFSHFQLTGLTITVTGNSNAQQLEVIGSGGPDTIDLTHVTVTNAQLIINGGAGQDIITGSTSNDIITGGPAVDVMSGGGGNDIFRHVQGNATTVVYSPNANRLTPVNGDIVRGFNIITDINVGDGIEFGNVNMAGADSGVIGTLEANEYVLVQGNFVPGTNQFNGVFTVASGGSDTLMLFDGNSTAGVQEEYVMLIGVNTAEAAASQYNAGLHAVLF